MSIAGVLRAICLASLCCVAFSKLAPAQSVLVRHSVVAEVTPVVGVRDSTWSAPREIVGGTQSAWSGEIRGNMATDLQVLVPREPNRTVYARAVGGEWVRLVAGDWNSIVVMPAGRRVVALELLTIGADGTTPFRPAVRVVGIGAAR